MSGGPHRAVAASVKPSMCVADTCADIPWLHNSFGVRHSTAVPCVRITILPGAPVARTHAAPPLCSPHPPVQVEVLPQQAARRCSGCHLPRRGLPPQPTAPPAFPARAPALPPHPGAQQVLARAHAAAARPPGHSRPGRRAPGSRHRDPRRCRPSAQTAPGDGARCSASAGALGSVLAERLAPAHSHPALAAAGLGKLGMARCPKPAQPQPSTGLLQAGSGQEPELGTKKLKRTHLQADRLLQRSVPKFCFALRVAAVWPASHEAQHVSNALRVTLAVLGCIRHTARLQVREDQCKVAAAAKANTCSSVCTLPLELLSISGS